MAKADDLMVEIRVKNYEKEMEKFDHREMDFDIADSFDFGDRFDTSDLGDFGF